GYSNVNKVFHYFLVSIPKPLKKTFFPLLANSRENKRLLVISLVVDTACPSAIAYAHLPCPIRELHRKKYKTNIYIC
ncbi:MAG: hypothetical protein RMK35_02575, partial [Aquificaceae bacterium]|nr:hypothetical protein [Aquificaceae bacterium]